MGPKTARKSHHKKVWQDYGKLAGNDNSGNESQEKSFINNCPIGTPAIANGGEPSGAVLSGGKIPFEWRLGVIPLTNEEAKRLQMPLPFKEKK